MKSRKLKTKLENVLYEFAASNKKPTYDVIQDWINRYPEFEQELIEFAVSWSLSENLPPNPEIVEIDEETLVLRGMSVVQNLMDQSESNDQEKSAPISNLINEAQTHGFSPHDLAAQCRLSIVLITKLHQRLIVFATIPKEVFHFLAKTLKRSVADLEKYLCFAPTQAQGEFRTSGRPQISSQQDFFEAVRTDPKISEEDRKYWLDLSVREQNE